MTSENEKSFIYISEKDFFTLYPETEHKEVYTKPLEASKEGELYKIRINNDLEVTLKEIAIKKKITIDDAFLWLMDKLKNDIIPKTDFKKALDLYKEGSNCRSDGDFETAINNYNKSIELCAQHTYMRKIKGGAYFHLGCIAIVSGDKEQANHFFAKCLNHYPEHSTAKSYLQYCDLSELKDDFLNRALFLNENNRHNEAIAILTPITSKSPSFSPQQVSQGYVVLGKIFLKLNDHKKAAEMFGESLHLNPDNQDAKLFFK